MGNGSVNGEAARPGQLHPCPIVTSDVVGAGRGEVCPASWLLSWRGPRRGRNEGRVGQETEGGSQGLCVRVCRRV